MTHAQARQREIDRGEAGVEGNSRLTSLAAIVLVVLFAIEGWTLPQVRQLLTLHVFVGLLLIGPVLLKIGTTTYRFVRYYRGAEPYVRRGPPQMLLRLLGPLVIVTSLLVLGTGVGLLATKPGGGGWLLTAHQTSFFAWFGVMTIHVLGHIRESIVSVGRELRDRSARAIGNRRRAIRLLVVGLSLAAGLALALVLTPAATPWLHHHRQHVFIGVNSGN